MISTVLVLLTLSTVADSAIHEAGRCVTYGLCSNDLPCVNNTLAMPKPTGIDIYFLLLILFKTKLCANLIHEYFKRVVFNISFTISPKRFINALVSPAALPEDL